MEKCPICGNYGTAITELVIETKDGGKIHCQRCNNCNYVSIDIDELKSVLECFDSKIEELESGNEELEEKNDSLKSEVEKLRSQLPTNEDNEMPDPEPSFDRPR